MPKIYFPTLNHARVMRRSPTRGEDRLWNWLRMRRFGDLKWRRQHPVGRYILDFYCAELQLAIEIDGRQHAQSMTEYDALRDTYLRYLGVDVLRITNDLFRQDSKMVEEIIRHAIAQRRKR